MVRNTSINGFIKPNPYKNFIEVRGIETNALLGFVDPSDVVLTGKKHFSLSMPQKVSVKNFTEASEENAVKAAETIRLEISWFDYWPTLHIQVEDWLKYLRACG